MKAQLLAVLILVGMVPMILFSRFLIKSYRTQAINQSINEIYTKGLYLSSQIVSSGYLVEKEEADTKEVRMEISQVAEIFDGRIIVVDKTLHIIQDTYGLYGQEEEKILIVEDVIQGLQGNSERTWNMENQYVELTIPIRDVEKQEIMGVILMNVSIKNVNSIYNILNKKAMILIITIGIMVILFGLIYASILTKPLKRVVRSIDYLSEGYLSEKVSIGGFLEIERISDSFNHMISKLQKLEESRQEFVSNVSHELKTPITSIKVLSDSLLTQEDVPADLYREFLVDITEEIERENKIINDLLSLVKLDKKAGEMNITSISINELLEQILKRLRPIAQKRNIELVFESFRPVVAEVDEVKLSLAVNNIIENAIKYNVDDGWVRVSLNADHKFFYIKVSDSGVGIPEDAQESIFERFYRVDKARSRETGGTGLGLSITRNAILMHRGAIKVYSVEKEGTTFTVRVPLNYIA